MEMMAEVAGDSPLHLAKRRRGRHTGPGRPPGSNESSLLDRLECVMAVDIGSFKIGRALDTYGISMRTYYRWLRTKDKLMRLTGCTIEDFDYLKKPVFAPNGRPIRPTGLGCGAGENSRGNSPGSPVLLHPNCTRLPSMPNGSISDLEDDRIHHPDISSPQVQMNPTPRSNNENLVAASVPTSNREKAPSGCSPGPKTNAEREEQERSSGRQQDIELRPAGTSDVPGKRNQPPQAAAQTEANAQNNARFDARDGPAHVHASKRTSDEEAIMIRRRPRTVPPDSPSRDWSNFRRPSNNVPETGHRSFHDPSIGHSANDEDYLNGAMNQDNASPDRRAQEGFGGRRLARNSVHSSVVANREQAHPEQAGGTFPHRGNEEPRGDSLNKEPRQSRNLGKRTASEALNLPRDNYEGSGFASISTPARLREDGQREGDVCTPIRSEQGAGYSPRNVCQRSRLRGNYNELVQAPTRRTLKPMKTRIEILVGNLIIPIGWYNPSGSDIKEYLNWRLNVSGDKRWVLLDSDGDEIIISDGLPSGRYTVELLR